MIEEGIIRAAIHSLTASSENEREFAVKLLLEFSNDEGYCKKIASQKGALVLLSSMAGNLEHPTLSNLAEEVLHNMEKVEENVQHLAAAGRFQPLLTRLCEGMHLLVHHFPMLKLLKIFMWLTFLMESFHDIQDIEPWYPYVLWCLHGNSHSAPFLRNPTILIIGGTHPGCQGHQDSMPRL